MSDRLTAALADRYRIERELGQGGMATVYLAHDVRHDRRVAIKVMRPELAAAIGPDRFLREIRTTANLRHPHIVPLYDSGESNGELWYVMPFIEGEALQTRLTREGPLGLEETLRLGREMAGALGYAHARGIVHRDIKPGNILLESGHAVIADFGIASAVTSAGGTRLTQTGMILGSPAYMSPEQASASETIDARSDLYSLACVVYEMLTGQPPFSAPAAMVVMARHMFDPVPPIRTARPDLPAHVTHAVERALAKAPADRYDTAEQWIAALEGTEGTEGRSAAAAETKDGDDGFRVAVQPFRHRGGTGGLDALAEGLTEEIVAGLSRFSYLRVMSTAGSGAAGERLGARYVLEGNLRQAGSRLRVAVHLVDTTSGAHLWADTYDRTFSPDAAFELQDELVPVIVATIADPHGVLPRSMSDTLRERRLDQLSPYEAVLRSYGYFDRVSVEEQEAVVTALESAVERSPGYSDGLAMLAFLLVQGYAQGFHVEQAVISRALALAHRAVEASPTNHWAHYALAQALFFRRDFQGFRASAERTLSLNPMDSNAVSHLGMLIACAGDWERGCALAERATKLNPAHPGWYWYPQFFNAYRTRDYRGALAAMARVNLPGHVYGHAVAAAAYAQLGEPEPARRALEQLLAIKPEFATTMRDDFGRWFDQELTDHLIDGLRKAGLTTHTADTKAEPAASAAPDRAVTVVVLPFVNRSPDPDNDWFSDGLTEEIITDLSRIAALRVISRNSSMALRGAAASTASLADRLGVSHVITGSVRRAGDALRITAELVDAASDRPLWSEKYAGSMHDVFGIQEEIAGRIVSALRVTLTPAERKQVAARPITDPVAYDCYLRARQAMYEWTPDATERGLRLVDDALAIIGDTPLLLATKAQFHWMGVNINQVLARDGLPPAAALADRALALEPDFAPGVFVRGLIAGLQGDVEAALPDLYRAHTSWPGDTNITAELCRFANTAGLRSHGRLVERLVETDPLTPVTHLVVAIYHTINGRNAEAAEAAARAIAMAGPTSMLHVIAAWQIAEAGGSDEAAAVLRRVTGEHGSAPVGAWAEFLTHVLDGRAERAPEVLTPDVEEWLARNEATARNVAQGFAVLDRPDDAVRWLRTALAGGFINHPYMAEHDRFFAPIRTEPSFVRLLEDVRPRWEAVIAWEESLPGGRLL